MTEWLQELLSPLSVIAGVRWTITLVVLAALAVISYCLYMIVRLAVDLIKERHLGNRCQRALRGSNPASSVAAESTSDIDADAAIEKVLESARQSDRQAVVYMQRLDRISACVFRIHVFCLDLAERLEKCKTDRDAVTDPTPDS